MAPLTADVERGRAGILLEKSTLGYDRDRAGISGVCRGILGIGAHIVTIFLHDRFNRVFLLHRTGRGENRGCTGVVFNREREGFRPGPVIAGITRIVATK